ncbi:unnamed protein product [Phytophthora fragariaefolia]|uniref:Unnamed protein product n=1 Tax=Phytophthora fragariaefolia TaxID=1490495 RepID=A0A9W6Y3J5_9STRA|nr:unnamed protein product [Phytophthora fragariaefolia]
MDLFVKQQILSRTAAKQIFQGELNLAESKARAAAVVHPSLPGQVPPARFGICEDPSSFVVSVAATAVDHLSEKFICGGFGGPEALAHVESLSSDDIQALGQLATPDFDLAQEIFLPRVASTELAVPEFRGLLDSVGATRELASLLQHYPVEGLARKVFRMSTLLKRSMVQLREAKRQLETRGAQASRDLLKTLTELRDATTAFALLSKYWDDSFRVAKQKLEQEAAKHAREFKASAQNPECEEDALQVQLARMAQDRDDLESYVHTLKARIKAGSMNVDRGMNALKQNKTGVDGNWPRLKSLLEHAKDNQAPPSD